MNTESQRPSPAVRPVDPRSPSPRVLIVEDDPVQQRAYAAVARRYEFEIELTSRTTEVLRLAHQFRPDAIFLDLNVEDGNTLRVLECLRSSPEVASTPVAVLSAYLVPETIDFIDGLPGVLRLAKPWQVNDLLALMTKLTGWRPKAGSRGVS